MIALLRMGALAILLELLRGNSTETIVRFCLFLQFLPSFSLLHLLGFFLQTPIYRSNYSQFLLRIPSSLSTAFPAVNPTVAASFQWSKMTTQPTPTTVIRCHPIRESSKKTSQLRRRNQTKLLPPKTKPYYSATKATEKVGNAEKPPKKATLYASTTSLSWGHTIAPINPPPESSTSPPTDPPSAAVAAASRSRPPTPTNTTTTPASARSGGRSEAAASPNPIETSSKPNPRHPTPPKSTLPTTQIKKLKKNTTMMTTIWSMKKKTARAPRRGTASPSKLDHWSL